MNHLLIFIAGIFIGSMINIYVNWGNYRHQSFFRWYTQFFYKNIRCIAIEIIFAVILVFLYDAYNTISLFIPYALLNSILTAASLKDLKDKIIPDLLILLGCTAGIAAIYLNPTIAFFHSLAGGVVAGGIFALISLATKGAIGMGDAKLFACIGLFLGLQGVLVTMLISTILSGIAGLVLLTFRIRSGKSTMPFAPFIMVGTLIFLLL